MNGSHRLAFLFVALFFVLAVGLSAVGTTLAQMPDDALAPEPTWEPTPAEDVQAEAMKWLAERKADDATKTAAESLWTALPEAPSGGELLECLAATLALADPEVADLIKLCAEPREQTTLPSRPWMTDQNTSPLVAHNMRLFYGRWLVHQELFDEAGQQLTDLLPADVVDPAALLFYQSVVSHSLLKKEEGLATIDTLLEGPQQTPRRYIALAQLMQQDLETLEEDSLGHIARRMSDVERRLDLGRAGKTVRKVEDGIVESLDKLIKKLEDEKKDGSPSPSNNIQSSNPAQDSQIIGGLGQGNVTKRNIGSKSGWGDLPAKEREAALQQIGREMPSHYRDAIEQYFRRIAGEELE